METAEGLCNRYVRNQMMASEPSDAEDFVRRAVRAVQAEWARIRIGDSTEGRDRLELLSRQIAAGEGERVKRHQGRSPAEDGRGKPRCSGPAKGSPKAEGIHELRRARRESEEATNPPEADASKGGGGVAEAGGAMEAPTPPTSGLESGGEEDAIACYVFSIPAEEYRPSTSAYVRVKVFKKTILAKMLIDSGNLVSDLISREFADLAGLQWTSMSQRGRRWAPQRRGGA